MSSGHCPRPGYLLCLNNVLWNYPWSFQFPNLVVQFTIPFIWIFPRVAFPPSPGGGAGPSNAGDDPGQSRLPGHPSSFPGPVSSGPSSSIFSSRTKDVLTRFSAVPSYRLIPQLSVIFTTMSLASKVLYFTQSSLPIELPLRRSRLKLLYLIGPSILQDSQTSPFIQKYLQTEVFLRQANLNIFLSVHQKVKTACRLTSGWGYLSQLNWIRISKNWMSGATFTFPDLYLYSSQFNWTRLSKKIECLSTWALGQSASYVTNTRWPVFDSQTEASECTLFGKAFVWHFWEDDLKILTPPERSNELISQPINLENFFHLGHYHHHHVMSLLQPSS